MGSSFWHGSHTYLGNVADNRDNATKLNEDLNYTLNDAIECLAAELTPVVELIVK